MGKTSHKERICEACPEIIIIEQRQINYCDLQTVVPLKLKQYTHVNMLKTRISGHYASKVLAVAHKQGAFYFRTPNFVEPKKYVDQQKLKNLKIIDPKIWTAKHSDPQIFLTEISDYPQKLMTPIIFVC